MGSRKEKEGEEKEGERETRRNMGAKKPEVQQEEQKKERRRTAMEERHGRMTESK